MTAYARIAVVYFSKPDDRILANYRHQVWYEP